MFRKLSHIILFMFVFILSYASKAANEKMKVVSTFTVIANMASEVAGDAAHVVSVTKPGAEIHGYEPTPQDIVRAMDADLILWNGMNLEIWFKQFLAKLDNVPSVILTENIDPIPISSGSYQGAPNPHAWMGFESGLIYIDNIMKAFIKYDPKNTAIYQQNAKKFRTRLYETIEPFRQAIRAIPENRRWLVTCEGAFSYLARDFSMKELYLWPINADHVGTPQQIRTVIDGVRKNNIPVVFCESTVNTAPARQIARETGAHYGGVLYVDSLSAAGGIVPTYLDLLRVTSNTIVMGLNKTLK